LQKSLDQLSAIRGKRTRAIAKQKKSGWGALASQLNGTDFPTGSKLKQEEVPVILKRRKIAKSKAIKKETNEHSERMLHIPLKGREAHLIWKVQKE